MSGLERRPTRLPSHRLARRALGAAVTIGTGTLIVTLAIDQPISIDISGKVEGRAQVIIGTPQAVDQAIRELPPVQLARQAAFPGAEGYGAQATWGLRWRTEQVARAGFLPLIAAVAVPNDSICNRLGAKILFVTNLNNSGSGSLREAFSSLTTDTLDIIIPRTGGTVTLSSKIAINNNCWIFAGQAAPGDGLQINGTDVKLLEFQSGGNTRDAVIRHVRFRMTKSTGPQRDVIGLVGGSDFILDHISVSFGTDETLSVVANTTSIDSATIQWSIIGPGLRPHSAGSLYHSADDGATAIHGFSLHHNLYINVAQRGPRLEATQPMEVINNINYNWKNWVGGMEATIGNNPCNIDWVRNYFKEGPWTGGNDDQIIRQDDDVDYCKVYAVSNIADAFQTDSTADQKNLFKFRTAGGPLPDSIFLGSRQSSPRIPVTEHHAVDARDTVLADVGANAQMDCAGDWVTGMDDALDSLLIYQATNGTGPASDADNDDEDDYGGIPVLAAGTPCTDTDSDGLPDTYETAQCGTTTCMDPRADDDGDGYINLEEYLNGTAPT